MSVKSASHHFFLHLCWVVTVKETLHKGNDITVRLSSFKGALCKFFNCKRAPGHTFVVSEVAILCGGFSIQFIANKFSASAAVHMCQDFFISSLVKKLWRLYKSIDFEHNAPPKHGSCIAIRPTSCIIEEAGHRDADILSENRKISLQMCSEIVPTTRRISRKFRRRPATRFFGDYSFAHYFRLLFLIFNLCIFLVEGFGEP